MEPMAVDATRPSHAEHHLRGQVAVVTGASRGIGKGIALALAQAGATVYITGRSHRGTETLPGSLEETATLIEAEGGQCRAIPLDHGDDAQVAELFARLDREQEGRLDLLVNNAFAGVSALRSSVGQSFWDVPIELWDACNGVGLRSHYVASVHAARRMVPRGRGLICTISSWGGLAPIFGVAYGVGKSGCDRLAAELARELRPHGVTALSLWPGIVGTEQIVAMAGEDPQAFPGEPEDWESPQFTGRVIAALAADPRVLRRSGRVNVVAELASTYGIVDERGLRPASLRSLRFVLPLMVPALRKRSRWIPDLRLPWWLMLQAALASPRPLAG